MKKTLLYCLTAIIGLGFASCKDDDEIMGPANPAEDYNRMPMTMFRLEENTNVSDDPYGMRVLTEELNSVILAWYGVSGAAGYEIKFGPEAGLTSGLEEHWTDTSRLYQWPDGSYSKIVPADQLTLRIDDLEYEQGYRFAIRVLHPDGNESRHSKWYGMGNGREWAEQAGLVTEPRYATPKMVKADIAESNDAFIVSIDINVFDHVKELATKESEYQSIFEDFKKNFDFVQDGTQNDMATAKFKVDKLVITPSKDTPDASIESKWLDYTLQPTDFKDGVATFRVGGLTMNAKYEINAINVSKPAIVDARYNSISKPIYGDPGAPILIEHKVWAKDPIPGAVEYNACPLDTVIGQFANNVRLAEGQVFYLEGGKAYYFYENPVIAKGFTLATNPDDVALGKRATVYLGGIGVRLDEYGAETAELNTSNFMFGRQRQAGESDFPIEVGSVIFENIDFDCPKATNFGHQETGVASASGNYFANMYSDGMEVVFESLEIRNCSFQRMIRGFLRVQGKKDKTFKKIVVDGNLFYNCGYYDNNGRGYAWIAGDGAKTTSNIFRDFSWTNNTMYDSPRTALISDNDKDINYADNVKWNIRIEGNTFINFSTRSSGRNFFQTRYVPGGSYYSFRRNLIVLARDAADERSIYQTGADIRTVKGSGEFSFNVSDNYSVGCTDNHDKDDKIFTGSQFSNAKNSFGALTWNPGNLGSKDDLKVKALTDDNGKALRATDLFTSPNPVNSAYDAARPNPSTTRLPPTSTTLSVTALSPR